MTPTHQPVDPIFRWLESYADTSLDRWVREAAEELRELNAVEIREAWEKLPSSGAFAFFAAERYTPEDVEAAAGRLVAELYGQWICLNQK